MKILLRYIHNVLLGIDQLGNTILGGDCDETISSRLGRIKVANGGSIPWSRPLAKIVDFFLDKIDDNHSIDAIEPIDHAKDGIIDKP